MQKLAESLYTPLVTQPLFPILTHPSKVGSGHSCHNNNNRTHTTCIQLARPRNKTHPANSNVCAFQYCSKRLVRIVKSHITDKCSTTPTLLVRRMYDEMFIHGTAITMAGLSSQDFKPRRPQQHKPNLPRGQIWVVDAKPRWQTKLTVSARL